MIMASVLKELTCNTSSSGKIDCGMSDHQLIFCTRKVKWTKFNKHNNVFLIPLKHYTVNVFVQKLQKVDFSNCERFSYIDVEYTDFLNKLMKVVNEMLQARRLELKIIRKNGLMEKLLS